jgi:hypothetical protein
MTFRMNEVHFADMKGAAIGLSFHIESDLQD